MYIKQCKYCKKDFEIKYKSWLYRNFCSHSCATLHNLKIKKFISKDRHPRWLGENVSYNTMHKWIQKNLGKPERCTFCNKEGCYNGLIRKTWSIQWANTNGLYIRDSNDWIGLCVKCHKNFDKGTLKRIHG